MQSSLLERWGGLAALVGGILGIVYAPFYALAYFATEDGASSLESGFASAWAGALRPVLEPFLEFAAPNTVYLTYGKAMTFVVLGWMAGLLLLHARQSAPGHRLERWGFRVAFTGASLAFLGSIGAYWIATFWWGVLDVVFFAFMIPALLLIGVGFPLLGIGTWRAGVAPRLGAALLIVGGLPGIIALSALFGQPTMGLLLINLGWIVLGYWLHARATEPAMEPAPAT
jgi:hypothetical protein